MEVQRKKPPTVIVSPGKSKKQEEVTPVKPAPKKAISTEKHQEDEEDVSVKARDHCHFHFSNGLSFPTC